MSRKTIGGVDRIVRHPDFFIVGAPKCGTSSLADYLRQHPAVFLPKQKDVPYFGSDLRWVPPRDTIDQYLARFTPTAHETRIGEACTSYLYSKRAATEIKEFCPNASIIIMLRNPVEAAYSMHSHLLWLRSETIADFGQALDAEVDRKRGERIPPYTGLIDDLFYRDTIKYSEQIERYYDAFGRANVHIILYDDFKRDTPGVVASMFRMLGVNPGVSIEYKIVNPNKAARSARVQEFFIAPPPVLEAAFQRVTPRALHGRVIPFLQRFNTQYAQRPALDPALKQRLQAELTPEVERLSTLLGQDLTAWCRS